MKRILVLLIVLVVAGVFGTTQAGAADRVIDDGDTIALPGNVHPLARPEFDTGQAPSSLPMDRMILTLRRSADKQAELDRFLAALQDPLSPNFHQWLSPEEFGDRFGPSSTDIDAITGWLTRHGFVVEDVAKGKSWINFSGAVAHVEAAFHTKIHTYQVAGRLYHANVEDPSIPRGLADMVAGVVSLNDFPRKAMHSDVLSIDKPDYTSGSTHYLSPGDFATIYNVNPLYSSGIDGTGQSIAIVGRTHPSSTNWTTFRSTMGLLANAPQVIVNGRDPGDLGANEDAEADLDVEWSGAVARNATIEFVVSRSTRTTDGVDLSAQYIVNSNLWPVMSTSFGACESAMGTSGNTFYSNLWQQAAAQGITAFVSSGDAGAAGCNVGGDTTGSGAGVNGLASTPYNLAVGGTQFNEGSGTYWNGTNGSGDTSAVAYIPEVAWNESGANGGTNLWSTGGGVSTVYPKPAWQIAPGVPSGNNRCVPDVSLSAAGHDAYLVETQGGLFAVGGTSAASPSLAGIMALIVQKTGQRQGNANARFYQLANAQYGAGGVPVFHDTTSGNNSVPSVPGYSAGTGYDCATGLGSVDAFALVTNWTPDFVIAASPNALSVPQGATDNTTIQTNVLGGFNSGVLLSASGLPTGVTAAFSPAAIIAPGAGASTMTVTVATSSPAGTYPVIVTGAGGGSTHTSTITLTIIPTYTVTSSVNAGSGAITPTTARIPSGSPAVFTIFPGTGYYLATLVDNGIDVTSSVVGGTYTIASVTGPHTVVAAFAQYSYTIAIAKSGNGSITDSSGSVSYGGSVTFTITPASGYTLSGLTDNGVAVSATQGPPGTFTYVITDVTANHTVDAIFTFTAAAVPAVGSWVFAGAVLGMLWLALRRKKGHL